MVLELLKQDGSIALIRAYVVDTITTMAKVHIPQEIREEFKAGTSWPESRFSGEIDILLGIEELSIHPNRKEIVGNLGVFESPLTNSPILGGRHEKIHPAKTELSQACMMMRRAAAPGTQQQTFKMKHGESLFELGDSMGDYVPK